MTFNISNVLVYPRKSREDEQREKETGEDSLALMTHVLLSTLDRLNIPYENENILPEIGSADTIEGRPIFSRIINELLPSGKYQGIAVREISRLGRGNFADAGIIYETLTKNRIYIITPNRIYDPSNKADLRFIRMELFMAREEYEMTKERLWYGKDERGKQGFAANYLPVLGLKSYRGKFTLIPEEIETLTRIMEMRANGESTHSIARILNESGVLSKKGKKWDPTSVWQIVHNKRYIGIATWNGQEVPAQHPPLVDIEIWNRVQEVNKNRSIPSNRVNNPYIVELWCHECGSRMYGIQFYGSKKKIDGNWIYKNGRSTYRCEGYRNKLCTHSVRADFVHEVVLNEIQNIFEKDIWNSLVKERTKQMKNENLDKVLSDKNKLLKSKKSFLNKLESDYATGELSASLYSKHFEQTERVIEAVEKEISSLKKRILQSKKTFAPTEVKKELKSILKLWDTLEFKQQKKIIKAIFPRIEYSKSGQFYITKILPDRIRI